MADIFIQKGKQKMRCGYTTGSCATGAVKACAEMIFTGEKVKKTAINTPKGIKIELDIHDVCMNEKSASCSVVKYSGDDPDITNGIKIFAEVMLSESGIEIFGGCGVGKVTKAGLDQPVGEWAINSVPRKMIRGVLEEIAEKSGYSGGFRVVISVPEGEEIARKTYNSRMGIFGGISIIGTSGLVEPMSSQALVDTIRAEASIRRCSGAKNMLLTLGNYSESFVQEKMPFSLEKSIKCSNFIGDSLDIALENGFEGVLLVGHIGKMVKLGAGIMNTHSEFADGRMDVLVTCGVLADVDIEVLKKIPLCATADSALDLFRKVGKMEKILEILAKKVDYYLNARVKGEIKVGAVIFSYKHKFAVKTKFADDLIKKISEE